jgi:hypothetical protein
VGRTRLCCEDCSTLLRGTVPGSHFNFPAVPQPPRSGVRGHCGPHPLVLTRQACMHDQYSPPSRPSSTVTTKELSRPRPGSWTKTFSELWTVVSSRLETLHLSFEPLGYIMSLSACSMALDLMINGVNCCF